MLVSKRRDRVKDAPFDQNCPMRWLCIIGPPRPACLHPFVSRMLRLYRKERVLHSGQTLVNSTYSLALIQVINIILSMPANIVNITPLAGLLVVYTLIQQCLQSISHC
jgi:hypothetical protein